MSKIIKIDGDIISIGTDNGSIKEVRTTDVNFTPIVGDEVEVFETEDNIIVSKKATKKEENVQSGININLSNSQNNTMPVYATQTNTKAVNKTTYCLLTFFLGGIGVHKFYAGKTGTGVLYLLFCWTGVPAFIALIEFIVCLCKKADANGNILV